MCERQHAKTCLQRVHIVAAQSARKNGNGLFPFRKQTVLIPFGGDKRDRTADLLNAIQALSQLSYTPTCYSVFLGGDKRDRTADLLNAIQALSQLSYTPIYCPVRNGD